jgi:RNA polymerase sigma-70 factor (ECF subfamily)
LRWLFFEERDKDEICRELNVDRGYLRVLLHRAKVRFRERFTAQSTGL